MWRGVRGQHAAIISGSFLLSLSSCCCYPLFPPHPALCACASVCCSSSGRSIRHSALPSSFPSSSAPRIIINMKIKFEFMKQQQQTGKLNSSRWRRRGIRRGRGASSTYFCSFSYIVQMCVCVCASLVRLASHRSRFINVFWAVAFPCCCCCCCRRFRVPFSCHKAHNMRCIYAKSAGHAGLPFPLPVPVPVPVSFCCRCRCLCLPLRLIYSFVAITFQPLHTTHSPLFPLFFLSFSLLCSLVFSFLFSFLVFILVLVLKSFSIVSGAPSDCHHACACMCAHVCVCTCVWA